MRTFLTLCAVIAALVISSPAQAGWFGGNNDQEQSANVTATAGSDVDVDVDTDVDTDVEIGNGLGNFSPSAKGYGGDARAYGGDSDQGQMQGQMQGQGFIHSDDDTTIVDANPSEGLKELGKEQRRAAERHAESAADVRATSMPNNTPCGDTTGLSAQTGVAGGSLATVPEVCRAYRLQLLRSSEDERSFSTTLATITHYAGWFPRLVLHVGSLGVLN